MKKVIPCTTLNNLSKYKHPPTNVFLMFLVNKVKNTYYFFTEMYIQFEFISVHCTLELLGFSSNLFQQKNCAFKQRYYDVFLRIQIGLFRNIHVVFWLLKAKLVPAANAIQRCRQKHQSCPSCGPTHASKHWSCPCVQAVALCPLLHAAGYMGRNLNIMFGETNYLAPVAFLCWNKGHRNNSAAYLPAFISHSDWTCCRTRTLALSVNFGISI